MEQTAKPMVTQSRLVIVPIEPTSNMVDALSCGWHISGAETKKRIKHYTAAVKAAPDAVQQLIEACVPGGAVCDPQQVADSIRAFFSSGGSEMGEECNIGAAAGSASDYDQTT